MAYLSVIFQFLDDFYLSLYVFSLDKKADNEKFSDDFTKNESDTEEEFFECEGKNLIQHYFY